MVAAGGRTAPAQNRIKVLSQEEVAALKSTNDGGVSAVYNRNQILTASPAELNMMLYNGAIKFCNLSKKCIEEQDMEGANNYIQKARKIIVEFRNNLDFTYEVAKDFDRVYEYIYYALVEANVKKDPEMIDIALHHIKEMKDAWRQVMEANKGK